MWSEAAPWERKFHETVTDLIADGGLTVDLSTKVSLLEKLADNLEHETETADETVVGRMLALWILIVGNVDQVSVVSYKYICFRLMTMLLRRPEFKLQSLDFDFNTQDVRKEGDPEAWRRIHLVRKLVSDTFVYSSKLLLHDNQSDATYRFCAVVAAHAYFVFPMMQAPFVDICIWRYGHHQAIASPSSSSSFHSKVHALVRAMSLQPTHTEFMDRTPDLFHWGWLAKQPSDAAMLPDDSTWRYLLDANDGHLFCAFVQAFHDHVDRAIDASASHVSVVGWGMVPGYLPLMQLFAVVLYDAVVVLTDQFLNQDRHPPPRNVALAPSTTLFPMTPLLCETVLRTATVVATCGHLVPLWLVVAVAAASTDRSTALSKSEWAQWGMPPCIIQATTAWIQVGANPHTRHKHNSKDDSHVQSLLLYPSYIRLHEIVVHMSTVFPNVTCAPEGVVVSVMEWVYTHIQRLPIEDKAVVANSLLVQPHFYALFLHWSPKVRLCLRHLLVYRLFRHDRRTLHLASDTSALLLGMGQDKNNSCEPSIGFPVEDKPEVLSDSPSLMLDLSLASKVDTFVYMLGHPRIPTTSIRMFPEALDIFVDEALLEYGVAVQEYYHRCATIEANERINPMDVVEGPPLASLLAALE
ncbi:hypothetical protein B5M09_002543 [Aphanomyces astaci]|uniref:Uncharacterized protein n=1 Tax=Aphanomyces astaci TaxID=112090 RepID=A0A3R7YE50_APHAT|nr:hypothetical protein B5M09_002543 [Aphanomyces astaci]